MARHNKNGRSAERISYVLIDRWILSCAAWRSLDPVARCLYLELEYRYNGTNNGAIFYSVRQAATDLHCSKTTASRAFDRLVSRGFVAAAKKGAFSLKVRHATEWRLTRYTAAGGAEAVAPKDFIRWSPETEHGPCSGTDGPSGETVRSLSRNRAILKVA